MENWPIYLKNLTLDHMKFDIDFWCIFLDKGFYEGGVNLHNIIF